MRVELLRRAAAEASASQSIYHVSQWLLCPAVGNVVWGLMVSNPQPWFRWMPDAARVTPKNVSDHLPNRQIDFSAPGKPKQTPLRARRASTVRDRCRTCTRARMALSAYSTVHGMPKRA